MKRLFVILLSCIMLFNFASCTGGSDKEMPEAKVVMEGSKLREGKIYISADTEITINDTGDGYYSFRTVSSSAGRSVKAAVEPSNVLSLGEGAYIAVGKVEAASAKALAEGNEPIKVLTIKGRDLGITGTGYITVKGMKSAVKNAESKYDMKLEEIEDDLAYFTPEQYPVYEEYYHLTRADLEKLVSDPSRVLLTTHSYGSGTGSAYYAFVSIDHNGNITQLPYTLGLYDLSKYESIDIINSMTVRSSNNKWSREIILSNPETVEIDKVYELPTVNTYIIPKSNDTEYVIELIDVSKNVWVSNMFGFRSLTTGLNENQPMPIALDYRNIYYLGKVTEDSLVDVSAYGNPNEAGSLGKFKVRAIEPGESSMLNKRIISVDSATVKIELDAGGYKELDFRFDPKLGDLTKKKVEVSAKVNGQYYDDAYVSAMFMSRFNNGYGYSTSTIEGPYGVYECVGYDSHTIEKFDAMQVSIENHSNEKKTVTLSINVSDITVNKPVERHIWILPWGNGKEPVEFEFEESADMMVKLPECTETREGFVFKGWRMIDNYQVVVKQPGEMIQFTLDSMTLSPVWEAVETTE